MSSQNYRFYSEPERRAVADPLWRCLAQLDRPIRLIDLANQINAHPNAIQLRLKRWERAGLVRKIEARPCLYQMTAAADRKSGPPTIKMDGSPGLARGGNQRMWSAMRILKQFDIIALGMAASVTRRSCETYVNSLLRTGFLARVRRGNPRNGEWSIYRLTKPTGPIAPSVSHRKVDGRLEKAVVDHNDGTRYPIEPRSPRTTADGGEG